jgi:Nucleoside phosphorylase
MSDLRILIVENRISWQDELRRLLINLENGTQINVASDFETAMKYLKKERFDLAVIDLALLREPNEPEKSDQLGIDLCRELRMSRLNGNCGLIILTGYATKERTRVAFRDYAADDVIDKSDFDDAKFVETACEAIRKARIREITSRSVRPTIGIVTALEKEYAAVKTILQNEIEHVVPGRGAGRRYVLGEIPSINGNNHHVAISLADMGNNIAAARAALLLEHFPNVQEIAMVGIAGGVPSPKKPDEHVRLGDVVVSNQRGIIQYDFDKETPTETLLRFPPRPPSARLIEAIRLLKADEMAGHRPWLKHIDATLNLLGIKRPSSKTDILLRSALPRKRIAHPPDRLRKRGEPRIFIGPIASANKLLKNPIKRDMLRDVYGVKAIEMEGSGVADATWNYEVGYVVIRGICDYCDTSKTDLWQEFAAVVASAYTRALLESVPTDLLG